MGSSLLEQIEALSIRVNALENKQTSTGGTAQEGDHSCEIEKYALVATDPFACKIYVKAIAMGLRNVKLVRARDDYYNHDLPWRRRYLRAPSTEHLCKSIVMCNTKWKPTPDNEKDPLNAQYYCVVVQYSTKLSANDLTRIIKQLQSEDGRKPLGSKVLHYRLAEDCLGVTGYEPNGVTPIGLNMPIVIDRAITKLEPGIIWCGGGEISLKLRLDIPEFLAAYKPIVGDVTPDVA